MTNRYVVQPGAFYENPKTGKVVCSLVFPGSDKIKPGDTITLPDDPEVMWHYSVDNWLKIGAVVEAKEPPKPEPPKPRPKSRADADGD